MPLPALPPLVDQVVDQKIGLHLVYLGWVGGLSPLPPQVDQM